MTREASSSVIIDREEVIETLKVFIFGNFEISSKVRMAIGEAISLLENENAVIDRVLEIIGSKKVDVGYIDTVGLDEYMHRLGWNDALAIVKVAVLALKGGNQE